jgi:hypothetical protein
MLHHSAFGMLPVAMVYVAAGTVVLLVSIDALRERPSGRWRRYAVAVVPGFAATVWLAGGRLMEAGDAWTFHVYFERQAARYEAIVQGMAEGRIPVCDRQPGVVCRAPDGTEYVPEPGEPLRLAFPRPGGLLDNWEGVVYDPSGAVAAAQGWTADRAFSAPPEVARWFGGALLACRAVRASFYRCTFT